MEVSQPQAGCASAGAADAPIFPGLPPADSEAQRAEYAEIARSYDQIVNQPIALRLNKILNELGVGPLSMGVLEAVVELAGRQNTTGQCFGNHYFHRSHRTAA